MFLLLNLCIAFSCARSIIGESVRIPIEKFSVEASDDSECFARLVKLSCIDKVARRLWHPEQEHTADDVPDKSNEHEPKPMPAYLPEVESGRDIDQGLLRVPARCDGCLRTLRQHLHEVDVADTDADG